MKLVNNPKAVHMDFQRFSGRLFDTGRQEGTMKKKVWIAALTASLLTFTAVPSLANEGSTTTSPRDTAAIQAFKSAMASYKADLASYKATRESYAAQMTAYRAALE